MPCQDPAATDGGKGKKRELDAPNLLYSKAKKNWKEEMKDKFRV